MRDVERIYKAESGRVLATLVRLPGDLDTAEEALHEAFATALEQWPQRGTPANPYAWLASVGKFKAIDGLRRNKRGRELLEERLRLDESPDAAIVDRHALAASVETTAWDLIVGYYDMLLAFYRTPAPVIEMNRAIAVGMHAGPAAVSVRLSELWKAGSPDPAKYV